MTAALLQTLVRDVTTAVLIWRLDRADGVALGHTAHDRDIRHGGLVYRASPGMAVSAIVARSALDDDGISLRGAITEDGFSAEDIAAGRWSDARVAVDLVAWDMPALGTIALFRGVVTSLAIHGGDPGSFELEAQRDLAVRANSGALRTTPMCRADLGDRQCGVDMDARTRFLTVSSVDGAMLEATEPLDPGPGFVGGQLRFMTGANAGADTEIESVNGATLLLRAASVGVEPGAIVRVREGCDKRFETCVERFGNASAFAGEPHLPGRDALVRYGMP